MVQNVQRGNGERREAIAVPGCGARPTGTHCTSYTGQCSGDIKERSQVK